MSRTRLHCSTAMRYGRGTILLAIATATPNPAFGVAQTGTGPDGFGRLVNGRARILLDPTFAQTVSTDRGYHVFVQPYGRTELYVSERNALGFTIELKQGAIRAPSSATASWPSVRASRRGGSSRPVGGPGGRAQRCASMISD